MFKNLVYFEFRYFSRKPIIYIIAASFLLAGIMAGSSAGFSFPNVYKNSPYEISYLAGIFSLLAIFSTTLIVAQSVLRETDSGIAPIVYSTPVAKHTYLFSRFISVTLFSILSFATAALGIFLGNIFSSVPEQKFGAYFFVNYFHPLLVLALPNIFLCVAVLYSTAWLTRNKLIIYVAGLFIYIIYIIGSIFSNSPLIAGATPSSPEQMDLFAKLDPLGLAAFFEQTRYWTAAERNHTQVSLSGNLLFNRLLWFCIAIACLLTAYGRFSFRSIAVRKMKKEKPPIKTGSSQYAFTQPAVENHSFRHHIATITSFVKLDLLSLARGIPFLLVVILWTGLITVELYNALAGDPRLGANYARTGLIVSTLLDTIPFFSILVVLFFSSELLWKSRTSGFQQIEASTPAHPTAFFISKLITVGFIPLFLIVYSCLAGILFQSASDFHTIDLPLYGSLLYFIGLPLLLSVVLIIAVQVIIKNKYAGLAVAAVIVFILQTPLAGMLGITSPLVTYGKTFNRFYGDMNGFGDYPVAFHYTMIFHGSLAMILLVCTAKISHRGTARGGKIQKVILSLSIMVALLSGVFIYYNTKPDHYPLSGNEKNNWKQLYETRYKPYKNFANPTITNVTANVDLFPSRALYQVKGAYQLINKTAVQIDSLLIYIPVETELNSLSIDKSRLLKKDSVFCHYWYRLMVPLMPGDSVNMHFDFTSSRSLFKEHTPFNSIIGNGSFIRISRYFPRFGYNEENEITNTIERDKRQMPPQTVLTKLETPTAENYDYGFINLNMTVSTEADQTAVMPGNLVKRWKQKDRNYFQYMSDRLIPFRFAVSSARYKIRKEHYKNIPIEIYFDARHAVNVDKLLIDAKKTLQYCEDNFAPYPHSVARFAEISSFVEGFGATAYPSVIFMKENGGIYNDLSNAANHDVINGLAGHELSHQWWGSSQLAPEYKEGGWVLSETLANYTALMLYRRSHGIDAALRIVRQHLDQYLANRGFSEETPLFKTTYNTPHLAYNKGLVVMYQLYLLLGEEAINSALASLLKSHAFPLAPPTSQHLLDELYKSSPKLYHSRIDELFKQVIIDDASLHEATVLPDRKGYRLSIAGEVHKYKEDGKGDRQEVPCNEWIEIAIYTEDNQSIVQRLPVAKNKVIGNTWLQKKPVKVMLDPNIRMIDANLNDNERPVVLQ